MHRDAAADVVRDGRRGLRIERAAEFNANDVAVGIDAEVGVAEFLLDGAQELRVLRSDGDGGGISASDFLSEGWAA